MAERRPLVLIDGTPAELPSGDTAPVASHTHAGSDIASAVANATTAANCSRSVVAGTGLTGGGDLTANRTLTVAYGATVGTACQGDDARLSNSREWTAATVTQAEAEAGTATTRRAWTAQRVFQAIGAWWNASAAKTKLDGIAPNATANATDAQLRDRSTHTGTQTASTISDSTAAGRALLTAADAAAQRMSLGLVKQESISDFTPSRVALVDYIPRPSIDQIAGISPTLDLDFERQVYRHYSPATGLREKDLSDIVTFTRASSATYFDAKGVMQTASSDEPRIDFDPETGGCKGLLIEERRVNSFLNSLADGTSLSTQTVTVTAASWTISFYGTGSITLSGAHSATITGTADTTRTALTFTPAAGSLVCTVSGTVKWANCEPGAFATSFIPTAGATIARFADVAVISGTAFSDFYRQGVGSFLHSLDDINGDGFYGALTAFSSVSQTGETYYLSLATPKTSPRVRFYGNKGGTQFASLSLSTTSCNGKTAVAFSSANLYLTKDGAGLVDTTVETPFVDALAIGSTGIFNATMCGCVKRLSYFPQRLPDATLQQLTAG